MKKKNIFLVIVVALTIIFSGCEKIIGEDPEDNHDNDASYTLVISSVDYTKTGRLSFSVIADPPTDYVDVDLGYPDESVEMVDIYLPLNKYEGKTITIIVYATRCISGPNCEDTEEIVVKKGHKLKHLHFSF